MADPDFKPFRPSKRAAPRGAGRPLLCSGKRADQNLRLTVSAQVRGRPGLAVIAPSELFTFSTVL